MEPIETYSCCICRTTCATQIDLEAHISSVHLEWIPYECSYCGHIRSPTEELLIRHQISVHPEVALKLTYYPNRDKKERLVRLLQRCLSGREDAFNSTDMQLENSLLAMHETSTSVADAYHVKRAEKRSENRINGTLLNFSSSSYEMTNERQNRENKSRESPEYSVTDLGRTIDPHSNDDGQIAECAFETPSAVIGTQSAITAVNTSLPTKTTDADDDDDCRNVPTRKSLPSRTYRRKIGRPSTKIDVKLENGEDLAVAVLKKTKQTHLSCHKCGPIGSYGAKRHLQKVHLAAETSMSVYECMHCNYTHNFSSKRMRDHNLIRHKGKDPNGFKTNMAELKAILKQMMFQYFPKARFRDELAISVEEDDETLQQKQNEMLQNLVQHIVKS